MISLRQRVLWASLMASAAFAASAQQTAPVAAPVNAPVQAQVQPAPAAPEAAKAEPGKRAERADRAERKKLDPAQRMERMQKRHEQRLAQLKTKLQLTQAQEGAWTSFTTAMKPPAPPTGDRKAQREEFSKLTTPERLDRAKARQAERSARFAERAEATKSFYAQLSPEQQKTFDAETLRKPHGPRHGHGPHHRHHGGDKPAEAQRS